MMSRSPVLILAATPLPSTLRFADALAKAGRVEVTIISDNTPPELPHVAACVHIDDAVARENGFLNAISIFAKSPTAWDKAMYHLMQREQSYDYVWLVEDDVFFTHATLCERLVEKYAADPSDLVVRNFFLRDQHPSWPHWRFATNFSREHQAGVFMPLCRISRRLVELAADYARRHGSFTFHEVLFPSLAVAHELPVKIMGFIGERRFHAAPAFNRLELLQLWGDRLEDGIFHPVKSDELRSMQDEKPSALELGFCRLVGPFLTRRAQRAAKSRESAYQLTASQIRCMVDTVPS